MNKSNLMGKLVFWFILFLIGLLIYQCVRPEANYNSITKLAPIIIILSVIELFLGSFIWPIKQTKYKK